MSVGGLSGIPLVIIPVALPRRGVSGSALGASSRRCSGDCSALCPWRIEVLVPGGTGGLVIKLSQGEDLALEQDPSSITLWWETAWL